MYFVMCQLNRQLMTWWQLTQSTRLLQWPLVTAGLFTGK